MTDRRGMDLADYIRELTEAHHHVELYQIRQGSLWVTYRHLTRTPSLIAQLRAATPSSSGEDRANAGYSSRPVARLEALDCLARIDIEASRWVKDMGEDDPLDTAACIRRLHGLTRSAAKVTQREVEHDARRWWTQARIVSGWDSPAWRPDNTCPLCGVKGGLRVKLGDQTAFCAECGETWSGENISLLADHIRNENRDAGGPVMHAS